MKKFAILAAVVALIGCAQNDEGFDNITSTPEKSQTEFYASMPECDTRTYVEDNRYLRWNADDEITVFAGNSYNGHWQFAGEDGANSGKFNEIGEGGFVTGTPLDLTANYAIYPYDENISISEAGVVSLTLPAVQEYNHTYANSFGAGANTMMAVTKNTSDNFLAFKNLCGYLKLKFYGEDVTVKSITVKGNNGEKIAGKATVTMVYGNEPTITMGNDATDTITIDCGEGVTLSSDEENPTIFWVAIPEITFEGGFTIEVTDINDQIFEKKTANAVPIENNLIQPMVALGVEFGSTEIPENWKIYYTASELVEPNDKTVFGVNYVSNEWDETTDKGVITFDGKVTSIGGSAFYNCTSLTSITIPDSVTSIGEEAFWYCTSLTSITIPDGVTEIGWRAFGYCTSLVSITIPDSVTSIENDAFWRCTGELIINSKIVETNYPSYLDGAKFSKLTIGDSVTSIGKEAFKGRTSLTSVTIPDSVTEIGYSAFYNCTSLTCVTIGSGVTEIGDYAFYNCTSLKSITIPDSVTSIGGSAFDGCTSLPIENNIRYADRFLVGVVDKTQSSYNIIEGTRFIGDSAFYNCTSLARITIPNSVTSIGGSAFDNCTSLTSITIPDSVTSIESSTFYCCTSLTSITIPEGITSIGDRAFYNCTSLARITIPNSVTEIGDGAFIYCQFEEINIPDSVVSIGNGALGVANGGVVTIGEGVTSLGEEALYIGFSTLYIKAITPPAGLSLTPFQDLRLQMSQIHGIRQKIYVPQESYNEYLTVFSNIFGCSESDLEYEQIILPYDFE